ncbi:MAG: cadherin-like beta sandwich domain-containing protein [Clostridia bacterium]|nr:cadherin-like beta sandwich domain-containing protein [Clostridia bacterium]
MKNNAKPLSKRGKIIAIIVAIILACCITVSGVMLFKPQKNGPVATNAASTTNATVTIEADKTEWEAGDEVTLTITFSEQRTNSIYYAAEATLVPLKSDGTIDLELCKALKIVGEPVGPLQYDVTHGNMGNIAAFGAYTLEATDRFDYDSLRNKNQVGLYFYCSKSGSASLSTTQTFTFEIKIKVDDNYSGSSNFKFGLSPNMNSYICTLYGPEADNNQIDDKLSEGNFSAVSPDFKIGDDDGSGGETPTVQPTLSKLELSTSMASGYSEVTSGGGVTWKLADHAVNSYVYFRATVPTGATASASTGLDATSTANVFRGRLAYGTNTFKVKVQGTSASREYTYTIKLLEQVNTISSITASPALTGFTFNPATTSYSLEVENSVSSLTLTVTIDGDYETLTASGSPTKSNTGKVYTLVYNLSTGTNTITLRGVSDESVNGTQYTFTVKRKTDDGSTTNPDPSTDSSLTGLEITSGGKPATLSPTFRPDKTDGYTATVDDIDDINVNPTPNPDAKNTETKITDNGDGTKTVTVTVTAEDDTTTEYVITVKEKDKPTPPVSLGDAILDAIYVNKNIADDLYGQGDLIPGFKSAETDYKIFVPYTCEYVRLTAIAESNADVVMYTNGEEADPANLGKVTDIVHLANIGDRAEVQFVVTTSEDTRTYTVVITRSTQAPYLNYLTVGNYQIYDANGKAIDGKKEDAVRDVKDFYVTIENADTIVNVVAKASPENATVLIQNKGNFIVEELFNGKATVDLPFSVVILDDDNTPISETIHYTLHLTRKPKLTSDINARIIIDEITKAHNSVIFNDEYAQDWNTDRIVYGANEPYYRVPYNVSALTIHVYPDAIGELIAPPTYQIFYGDVLKSDNGAENTSLRLNYTFNVVTIVITSSDLSTSKTVVVIVYREEPSLSNPVIVEIPDFKNEYQPEVTDYAYTVGHDVTKLTVQVGWDTAMYTCVIEGADSLKIGHNIVTISLYEKASGISNTAASTDKPNAVRTITLDVFRESNGPSTIWLILFIVFLVLAILEFLILLLLLLRNRRETEKVTERVVVQAAPAPVVRQQLAAPPVAPQVQYIAMPQPQVQYVAMPQPRPQPVEAEKPQQPVNVEVKITGCGDSDGYYKTKK